jgi:hypothetical protein
VSYSNEQVFAWASIAARRPPDKIGSWSEQHDDPLFAAGTASQPGFRPETRTGRATYGGGWGKETRRAAITESPGGLLAAWIVGLFADHHVIGQVGLLGGWLRNLDCPQGPVDANDVERVGDSLVAQEFGPGGIRSLGEVMNGALTRGVPTTGRLSV